MTTTIIKGYLYTVKVPKFGESEIFAPTLEDLDRLIDAYISEIENQKNVKAVAPVARQMGKVRADYARAREAMEEGTNQ